MVEYHKVILASSRTHQDEDCAFLDSLMMFCSSFYDNHQMLSVDTIKNLTELQFNRFSSIHGLASGLYQLMIGGWLHAFSHPLSHKELCKELSWDAIGRFTDICRPASDVEERKEISQKRDLSLFKGWADLVTNKQWNLSAYRLVSRICERDNTGWGNKLRPAKGLSLLDDAGDPDVVHAFVFGNFTYLKSTDSTLHGSVIVFIRIDEALTFLQRAKLYKVFLDSFRETLGLTSPKLGKAYLVDPKNCQILGSISASDMTIHYFNP